MEQNINMEVPQSFCVRWNSYKSNLQTAFPKLLTSEHFVDVTLACEKQFIKCHKIVLSACSVYFENLLINNPCQHPIIFMKDVEFWEIQALVEFMYKGEVNVSHNQLDRLLKSAESLQIRGLCGAKQVVSSDDNNETQEESVSDGQNKRNKCENDDDEDGGRKRKKKVEEDEKCVQITSVGGADDFFKHERLDDMEHDTHQIVKTEEIELEDYNYENAYMNPDEQEKADGFSQDMFYPNQNNDPGPSQLSENNHSDKQTENDNHSLQNLEVLWGPVSDLCSLALNHVECVMDPEKAKTTATTTLTTITTTVTTSSVKCSIKNQARHQEHNYTNPSKTGDSYQWDESSVAKTTSSTTTTTAPSTTMVASSSDSTTETSRATYSGTRSGGGGGGGGSGFSSTSQSAQPTSTLSGERHAYEVRSRVIKKDVFNRIRRSEEELQKAAEMVRGGMTFQTASDTFKIPISTIRFYMARRGILPQRRRGRGSSGVRDDDLIHPPFEIIHYRLPDIDRPV